MSIIFSMVSRGIISLAKHATCAGNFDAVMAQILVKIQPENDAFTYTQGGYFFHYISENQIIYICITDEVFNRSKAFLFLLEIKRIFQSTYGNGSVSALPYVIETEFSTVLADQMQRYNTSGAIATSTSVQNELDELAEIMAKNVDSMNGENVRLLVNIADGNRIGRLVGPIPETQARAISKTTIMFWLFFVVANGMVIYALGTVICDGPSWKGCRGQ